MGKSFISEEISSMNKFNIPFRVNFNNIRGDPNETNNDNGVEHILRNLNQICIRQLDGIHHISNNNKNNYNLFDINSGR